MHQERRDFMKCGALSVLGLAGERVMGAVSFPNQPMLAVASDRSVDRDLSVIGVYGSWAASLHGDGVPSLSLRNERFADVEAWRVSARKCVTNRMAIPGIGSTPKISFRIDIHASEFIAHKTSSRLSDSALLKENGAPGVYFNTDSYE